MQKELYKCCFLFFCMLQGAFLHAQLTLTRDTVVCKGSSIDLHAYVSGAVNTTHYAFSSTSYHWDTVSNYTTLSSMKDDEVRGPLNIGFTFSFLCGNYTQFYIGSNGWISFGTANDISWNVKPIPSPFFEVPKNAILGPWEDWNPAIGGQITYGIKGTAPFRKLVVSWINVPMFSCPNLKGTFQIVIEETTNLIQNNILYKPASAGCNSLTGINATQGVHNMSGTVAFIVPGRNATIWSTVYESIKFIPDIDSNNIMWSFGKKGSDNNKIAHGSILIAKPDTFTTYSAFLFKCDGEVVTASVNVNVISGMTSVLANHDTTICKGQPVVLSASASGGKLENYHYFWMDKTVTTSGIHITYPDSSVKYKLIVSDYCSLPDTHFVNINVRPPLKINVFKDSTICFGRSINITPRTSGGDDSSRFLDWGSSTGNGKIFNPIQDTLLYLLLKDNCTILPDTARIQIRVRPPLNIKTNNDTTLCFGDSLRLKTVSSGGDSMQYHYSWNYGIGSGAKVNFVPDSSRTYLVMLTDGCTPLPGSDTVNIRVRRAPQIQRRGDSTICRGQSIILFAVPVNGDTDGVSFLWSNGIGVRNFIRVIPDSSTQYKVSLNDRCLINPESDSVMITIRHPLSITVKDTLICYGKTINIGAKGNGGFAPNYQFKWNTGVTEDTLFNVTPLKKTTYNVVLSDNCTIRPDTADITVDVHPPLSVKLPADTTLCAGSAFTVNSISGGGLGVYQYKWNGQNSSDSFETIRSKNDTSIIVQLTDGCSISAFDTMQISREANPVVDYTFDELSNCGFAAIDFRSNSVYKKGSVFKWSFNDGNFSSDSFVVHKFLSGGNYNVWLSVVSPIGCNAFATKVVPVSIRESPVANFTASSFSVDILSPAINFKSLSADSLKHEWIFGNTGITSTVLNPVVAFSDTGSYLITLIVQNSSGCTDTLGKWVRVDDVYTLYVPNSFTPNNDGLNDVFETVGRGVKEYKIDIFDRGGNVIFESHQLKNGWNGRLPNGTDWPSNEVFFYKIFTLDIKNQTHQYSGSVTMLR